MGWEEGAFALLDDLEQQAEGLHLLERDADVAELTAAEYAHVELVTRLHASLGLEVRVAIRGGCAVDGRLARMGEDWLLVVAATADWIVRVQAIVTVGGLSPRAHRVEDWPVLDRLSLRAVLRRLGERGESCLVRFLDGDQVEGRILRVGQDFLEMRVGEGAERGPTIVPLAAVSALQERAR